MCSDVYKENGYIADRSPMIRFFLWDGEGLIIMMGGDRLGFVSMLIFSLASMPTAHQLNFFGTKMGLLGSM